MKISLLSMLNEEKCELLSDRISAVISITKNIENCNFSDKYNNNQSINANVLSADEISEFNGDILSNSEISSDNEFVSPKVVRQN